MPECICEKQIEIYKKIAISYIHSLVQKNINKCVEFVTIRFNHPIELKTLKDDMRYLNNIVTYKDSSYEDIVTLNTDNSIDDMYGYGYLLDKDFCLETIMEICHAIEKNHPVYIYN